MSESKDLFPEFSVLSDEDWRAKVIQDLKGKNFEETLVWKDVLGLEHQPYYRASSIDRNHLITSIQKVQKSSPSWVIAHELRYSGALEKLKEEIQNALENGVEELTVLGLDAEKGEQLKELGINNNLCFYLEQLPKANNFSFQIDPIGEYLRGKNEKLEVEKLVDLFKTTKRNERFLLIDGGVYKSAGANLIQEIACTLQHALSYFDALTDADLSAEEVAQHIEFKVSFGNSYFLEIAKARALRFLIHQLFKSYKVETAPYLWGSGSSTYLAHKDPYTNLLRTTTQAMAAVIGNCDKVSSLAFDVLESSSKLGNRMAKNIVLILSKEAYLSEVADMAKGSYYIESLTAELAEKAWDEFLTMEEKGGVLTLFESGELQQMFDKSWSAELESYKNGKAMIGVNQFINEEADKLDIRNENRGEKGLKSYLLAKEID